MLADIDYEAATKAAEASKSLATDTDYRSLAIKVDVVDAKSVQRMIDLAIKEFGRIDYCINAAGVGPPFTGAPLQPRKWDKIIR